MVTKEFTIEYKNGDEFKLKPIFDVHLGNAYCDVDAFKAYLKDSDNKTYFVLGGDLLDSVVIGDKRYRKSVDASEGDSILDEQLDIAYDLLKPYARKILGIGIGNHEDVITKRCGVNLMKNLAGRLSTADHHVELFGLSALYRLKFRYKNGGGKIRKVDIYQHHGFGGGSRTAGGNITKFDKHSAGYDADIYLYGHVHQSHFDGNRTVLSLDRNAGLISKQRWLCICGTYLKTLSDNYNVTYSEAKGYHPTTIGGLTIHITPEEKGCHIYVSD